MAIKAKYIQRGESLDYTNGTEKKIEAGDVIVMGGVIGVAGTDILPGAVGSMHVMGVYEFPKGATAIPAGTALGWTADPGVAAAGKRLGYAIETADAEATTVKVLLDRSATA